MIQNAEPHLWALMTDLRSQVGAGEIVTILSQLCVLAALARKDNEFHDLATSSAETGQLLIGELLKSSLDALARVGIEDPNELLDINSSGWRSLPAAWIIKALQVLIDDNQNPEDRGRWLLKQARSQFRESLCIPSEIPKLVNELYPDAETVYLPFDESALSIFEITTRNQTVTLRPGTVGAQKLLARALFVADRRARIQKLDPYSIADKPEVFLTVIIPPFGEKLESMRIMELPEVFQGTTRLASEELALASIRAEAGQHVVALVPSGILFRSGLSRMIREWLVDTLGLVSVIEFPPRLLSNSSIGCALLSIAPVGALLRDSIRLASADNKDFVEEYQSGRYRLTGWRELGAAMLSATEKRHEAVNDVDKPEIRTNDYVLNPSRYQARALDVLLDDTKTMSLGSLCEIIRPLPIKDADGENTVTYREVLMSNFERDDTIRNGSKERFLDPATESKIRRQKLQPGDILLGVKGTIGKVAIVADDANQPLLAGQTTVILRLKNRQLIADPAYLLRYLSQPAVTEFLESMAGGSAIRFIRAKDLDGLPVRILAPEEQVKVRQIHDRIIATIAEVGRLSAEARRLNESAFQMKAMEG